ncbi:hypothetical protein ACFXPX_43085 [Kitasatospora sp. NPDC059146]|uniref:hypothetical protein n=1 Tax=unclassified Kitasatospora TaxID=2633591 RepID=UPI003689FBC5
MPAADLAGDVMRALRAAGFQPLRGGGAEAGLFAQEHDEGVLVGWNPGPDLLGPSAELRGPLTVAQQRQRSEGIRQVMVTALSVVLVEAGFVVTTRENALVVRCRVGS